MISGPSTSRPAVLRPSLLPSSIQLLRCTAEAVPRVSPEARLLQLSAGRWALLERTDQWETGVVPDTRRRLEDQPANRRWSRAWDPVGRPGDGPGLFSCCEGLLPKSEGFSADEGGGDEETRTPDPLLAKEMLCQLSYVPTKSLREVVGAPGLEPGTSALSGPRSNQLSYAPWMPDPEVWHCGRTVTLEEW